MKKILLLFLLLPNLTFAQNIQTTRWTPDTCDCVVEYTWDVDLPQEARVHTFKQVIKESKDHPNKKGKELYDIVLEENQRKNKALGIVQDILPSVIYEDYKWAYNANRELEIEIARIPITQAQKNQIKNLADTTLGEGKVKIK